MDKAGRLGRHRTASVAPAVSQIYLPPAEDELLSSYLVRRAHCQGLSPHRFTTRGLPGTAIWTRDIDASLAAPAIATVANYLRLSEIAIKSMTLYDWVGCEKPSGLVWGLFRRWVNAVGVYHRLRRRHGLQFCPDCLAVTPSFRRSWRLAFAFACPVHGVLLHDACPRCDAPVVPHRRKLDVTRCWRCGASLWLAARAGNPVPEDILALQGWWMRCVKEQEIDVGGQRIPSVQFLQGAIAIMRMLKQHFHSHPQLWPYGLDEPIYEELRFLRRDSRLHLYSVLYEMLNEWPNNFLHFAWAAGVSQVSLRRCGVLPMWMTTAVERLPAQLRSRQPASEADFVRYVRQLECKGGIGCRSLRAQALMRAAKGIYGH